MIASRFTLTVDFSASADAAYWYLCLVLHYTLDRLPRKNSYLDSSDNCCTIGILNDELRD